jgi:signal transduction histidine kinase
MSQFPLEAFPRTTPQDDVRPGPPRPRSGEAEQLALSKGELLAEAGVLGLRELCQDLQHELTVMECLVSQLVGDRDPIPLESALHAQVRVLTATVREARMPSRPRQLALRPLVIEAVETARLIYPGVIDLDASSEGVVEAIDTEVRRALVNLLDNACRTAPQGTVRVTVADEEDDVLLEVEDDGSGGLAACGSARGLAVVHDVARRHGGRVTRRAGPSGGQAVALRLPRLGV